MAPSRVAGGIVQSPGSSGMFYQGDGQSQVGINAHLSSGFGSLPSSVPSGDMNNAVLNGMASPGGPSVGGGNLGAGASSGLAGGPHLQRSGSMNSELYNRAASPVLFGSNNVSINGSQVIDGSSVGRQNSQDQNTQQMPPSQHQQQQQGSSGVPTLPMSQTGQLSLPMGSQVPGSYIQDPSNLPPLHKKPRLDIKHEDIMQQQVLQQLLQRQDPLQLQGRSAQLQALFQQQRIRQQQQQQQLLQSMPQMQRAQLQQQQQLQLRQQLQQQNMQPQSAIKRASDGSVCARRLMQYLYHQRQRPADNSIAYWRKFVLEYYSPRAKKRWCISSYDDVGQHTLGVFPQATMDAWQCDLCGVKSGKGFEATFEVLPRLNVIKFGSGVIDELLFLDLPRECKFPNGIMMLEYGKAIQETVYEQLRVVRTGQLRIIFTQDLKILYWEFCTRHHEELLPRRSVSPQVNHVLQVAQKCQNTIAESGSDGVPQQDLQTNSNMVLAAGRQLAKSLELQSLNELGFSKRYVRCLQIAEVVNGMKDLMAFCTEHKAGPIDGLKNFPRHANATRAPVQKMQETSQLTTAQSVPADRNTLNKLMAAHPGLTSPMNNNHPMAGRGALSGSAQAALALTNNQNLLMRQNSQNSNPISVKQEPSSSFNNPGQSPSSSIQGSASLLTGSMPNLPGSGFPGPHLSPQQSRQPQQLQHRSLSANSLLQQSPQSSQGNQGLQQQMIQQLLQEINNNNNTNNNNNNSEGGVQQHTFGMQNPNGNMVRNGAGFASNGPASAPMSSMSGGGGPAPSRSNSFKNASNSESTAAGGNDGFGQKAQDMPQNIPLPEDMVPHDFTESGFFNSDLDDNIGYGWKP